MLGPIGVEERWQESPSERKQPREYSMLNYDGSTGMRSN